MKSVDLMSLWNAVCSVLLCKSVRKRKRLRVVDRFFSHRAHRVHWAFWRTFRAYKIVAPPPTPLPQGGAWYVRLPLLGCLCGACGVFSFTKDISFSHRTHRFNRTFQPTFRTHRTPPAYRYHRTFQLKVVVRFCEIGWLNVSVECCVFCSSVFSVRKITLENCLWGGFLSQNSQI